MSCSGCSALHGVNPNYKEKKLEYSPLGKVLEKQTGVAEKQY